MKKLNNFLKAYLRVSLFVMITVSLFGFYSIWNPVSGGKISTSLDKSFLRYVVSFAFVISIVNIPVFVISAVALIMKRKEILLAILLLVASGIYYMYGRAVGDGW
jgi:putative copper export protein